MVFDSEDIPVYLRIEERVDAMNAVLEGETTEFAGSIRGKIHLGSELRA